MSDDKVILTPAEAEALLPDGDTIHNFVNPGVGMIVGCDYERASALEAFAKAVQIELGGEQSMRLKHPIIVWDSEKHYSFFQADMEKVAAFEAARSARADA